MKRMRRAKLTIQNGLLALVIIESILLFSFVGHSVRNTELEENIAKAHAYRSDIKTAMDRDNRRYSSIFGGLPSEGTKEGNVTLVVPTLDLNSPLDALDSLKETATPRVVHQALSGETFTFRNYLSILSVNKILRPYRILLYVPDKFNPKPFEYNKWFQKAANAFPFLEVVHLETVDIFTSVNEMRFITSVLDGVGGVYVNLNTVMNYDPWQRGNDGLQVGIAGKSMIGFVASTKQFPLAEFVRNITVLEDLKKQDFTSECVFPGYFKGRERCCVIQQELFPIDIMLHISQFAAFARFLFYGTSKIIQPQKSFPPIPKIVHYIWFGDKNMTYSMYLSFRSTLRFVKPLKVIIYVETNNLGSYFEEMKKSDLVRVVNYGRPKTVFQRPINNPVHFHVSDFVRTDVLLRLGGIYMDWDVYWLKPVDELLAQGYETIAALDHFKGMGRGAYPDTINMGVVLARPDSRFISLWQDSFHRYTGKHGTYHAVEMVYKIYEEHPDLLHIEKRLQVMCFGLKCHPLWLANYQDEPVHNDFDFTREAYAVHFTHPVPKEFESEKEMKQSKGFFADMARYVYAASMT